jgi:hypothetical protein
MRQHFAADLMLAFGIGVIDDHGPIGVAAVFGYPQALMTSASLAR